MERYRISSIFFTIGPYWLVKGTVRENNKSGSSCLPVLKVPDTEVLRRDKRPTCSRKTLLNRLVICFNTGLLKNICYLSTSSVEELSLGI